MKTIGIICARKGSVRLKNKNILKINSKTLVEIAYDTMKKTIVDETILYTDIDKRKIHLLVSKIRRNGDLLIDRSQYGDDGAVLPLQESVKKALIGNEQWSGFSKRVDYYDNLVILMPNAPMIKTSDINKALNLLNGSKLNIVRSYDHGGKENGLIVCKMEYFLRNHYKFDVYTGSICVDGIEIHNNNDYRYVKKIMESNLC